ncbi:MAG: hypothetical protein H0U59_05285 [Gemmatimonadaceae bacterium]|nr:hypothetical protein [Gemmatimonadaceae bacterium]
MIYGLIIGLAVGTAIGIVLADFWNSIRWRTVTRETLDSAREQRRKRLQSDERCELYKQLWIEALPPLPGIDELDGYSRKVPSLSVVEKAGV